MCTNYYPVKTITAHRLCFSLPNTVVHPSPSHWWRKKVDHCIPDGWIKSLYFQCVLEGTLNWVDRLWSTSRRQYHFSFFNRTLVSCFGGKHWVLWIIRKKEEDSTVAGGAKEMCPLFSNPGSAAARRCFCNGFLYLSYQSKKKTTHLELVRVTSHTKHHPIQ